jgi:hypothetical protein
VSVLDPSRLPRILTTHSVERLGVGRSRLRTELRRGNWRRIAPGVFLTRPENPSRWDWAEAALALAGPTSALSGADALCVLNLGPPAPAGHPVLVLQRAHRSRRVGAALLRRTARPFDRRMSSFDDPLLPASAIVSPARAVADAALLTKDLRSVRAMVARAVQRRACSVDEIAAELATGPRQGAGLLRRALGEVGAGARSAAEASALAQLAHSRLPEFELNVPLLDRTGRVVYVLDVFWRRYRAALEVDGRAYHFESEDWRATMDRHNAITAAGLSVVHYPPSAIDARGGEWLGEVERWLRRRAVEVAEPYVAVPRGARRTSTDPEPWRLGTAA